MAKLSAYPPVTRALPELKLVAVEVVDCNVVNTPVLGVALPIGVLLILAKLAVPALNVPPTFNAPPIPTPPVTTNAPVVVLVLTVLLLNVAPKPINCLLTFQLSVAFVYNNVALAPSTVIPAPFAAAAVDAPLATVMFKSDTSNVCD